MASNYEVGRVKDRAVVLWDWFNVMASIMYTLTSTRLQEKQHPLVQAGLTEISKFVYSSPSFGPSQYHKKEKVNQSFSCPCQKWLGGERRRSPHYLL